MSFTYWKQSFAYVGHGIQEGTMEEAMLHFFYSGLSPWIKQFGYSWIYDEDDVARKFVYHCYVLMSTPSKQLLLPPEAKHRDLKEDRETFDYIVDTQSFIDFLEEWKSRDEIVGTERDHLLREFCYIWIDPSSGKPGAYTERILEADETDSEEEGAYLAYTPLRKKGELY